MDDSDFNLEKISKLLRLKRDLRDEARLAKLYDRGITMNEAAQLVSELEDAKGFGHDLQQKLIWLVEELGEFVHAYKHNDRPAMAVELIDIEFFVLSMLKILGANADVEFMRKLEKNWKRVPVNENGEFHFDKR